MSYSIIPMLHFEKELKGTSKNHELLRWAASSKPSFTTVNSGFSVLPALHFCVLRGSLKRLAKKYPSLKNEFAELIAEISENPEAGTFIGNNCYKIRIAIASKGKGKRGGARVVTHLYIATETVYLLTIYDKSEKADLKPNELKDIIESLELD